jgi:hypothetical protein
MARVGDERMLRLYIVVGDHDRSLWEIDGDEVKHCLRFILFNTQSSALPTGLIVSQAFLTDQITGSTAVPEPAYLASLMTAALGLLGRRRGHRGAVASN